MNHHTPQPQSGCDGYVMKKEQSYRIILVLVAITTFLGPLFALASFTGGWVVDNESLPNGFQPNKLNMLNAKYSDKVNNKAYNSNYTGPYFDSLPRGIESAVTLSYILSILANILFPLKILGPWRLRFSILNCLPHLVQAIITIGALISFHLGYLKGIPTERRIFSTSYYATFISATFAVVSAIGLGIDYLLLVKFVKNKKGYGMSPSLMVLLSCLVLPSLWCHFGAFVYEALEGWHPLLGYYFSIVTITTIGFGDFHAQTSGGKSFLFIHSLIGILITARLATSTKNLFTENFQSNRERLLRRRRLDSTEISGSSFNFSPRGFSLDLGLLRTHVIIAFLNFVILWVIGSTVFMSLQEWSFLDSLYFSFTVFSTIGYGDFVITTYSGLLAFSCYSAYGIVTMSYFISVLAEAWTQHSIRRSRHIHTGWVHKLERVPIKWRPVGVAPPLLRISSSRSLRDRRRERFKSSIVTLLRHHQPARDPTSDSDWD